MPPLTNCYLIFWPDVRSNRLACNVRMTIDFLKKGKAVYINSLFERAFDHGCVTVPWIH